MARQQARSIWNDWFSHIQTRLQALHRHVFTYTVYAIDTSIGTVSCRLTLNLNLFVVVFWPTEWLFLLFGQIGDRHGHAAIDRFFLIKRDIRGGEVRWLCTICVFFMYAKRAHICLVKHFIVKRLMVYTRFRTFYNFKKNSGLKALRFHWLSSAHKQKPLIFIDRLFAYTIHLHWYNDDDDVVVVVVVLLLQ